MNKLYYEVEEILDKQIKGNVPFYLIKWVGYPITQATWEPQKNLKNVEYMIDEYEKSSIINKLSDTFINKKSKRIGEDSLSSTKSEQHYSRKLKSLNEKDKKSIKQIENKTPLRIINAKKVNGQIAFLVKWEDGSDGTVYEDSLIHSDDMIDRYPLMVCDFYESHMKIN